MSELLASDILPTQLQLDAEVACALRQELLDNDPLIVAAPTDDMTYVASVGTDPYEWRHQEAQAQHALGIRLSIIPNQDTTHDLAEIHAHLDDAEAAKALFGIGEYSDRMLLEKLTYRIYGKLFTEQLKPGNRVYEKLYPELEALARTSVAPNETATSLLYRGFMTSSLVNAMRYMRGAIAFQAIYNAAQTPYQEMHDGGYRPLNYTELCALSSLVVRRRLEKHPEIQQKLETCSPKSAE